MKQEIDFNNYQHSQHNQYQIRIDQSFHQQQPAHHNFASNYDQNILKQQLIQKFKNYRNIQKSYNQTKNSFRIFIRSILINILFFLQQIWLQIIPQSVRGVALGQKNQQTMDRFNTLYFGNLIHWLIKLRKKKQTFCIIVQQGLSINNIQSTPSEYLFDGSRQSNQKLKFLLQFQTISLTSKDLQVLQKDCHIDLSSGLEFKTYNFVQEFSIVGSLQITNLKRQDFQVILQQIKQHIRIVRQIQKQVKIEVYQHQKSPKLSVQLKEIESAGQLILQS